MTTARRGFPLRLMTTSRRGFTLIELLIAMVMVAVTSVAIYGLLINTQRLSRRQMEQTDLQADVRAGALILPAELREVGYDAAGSDLLAIGANFIRFRAMRGVGFTCQITPATEMLIRLPLLGYGETPAVGDQALFFVENEPQVAFDDQWATLVVAGVDLAATCPDGTPAMRLTVVGGIPAFPFVTAGGPIRFFERIQMGLYAPDGKSWLGARAIDNEASYQPVLGPLADGNGLELTYYDATGTEVPVTGNLNAIRTIEITLRGRSDEPVWVGSTGGTKIDELDITTRVALRNTLRP